MTDTYTDRETIKLIQPNKHTDNEVERQRHERDIEKQTNWDQRDRETGRRQDMHKKTTYTDIQTERQRRQEIYIQRETKHLDTERDSGTKRLETRICPHPSGLRVSPDIFSQTCMRREVKDRLFVCLALLSSPRQTGRECWKLTQGKGEDEGGKGQYETRWEREGRKW